MSMTVVAGEEQDTAEPENVVELLRRTFIQLQPGPDAVSDSWPNLTMQQLRVMRILYSEGATRVSVLARRLKVSTPTVTGILDRLVRQGLTYRADDPRDRRVVLNALTDQGTAVVEQLFPIQRERISSALDRLTGEDQRKLAEGLRRFLDAMQGGV